MHLLSRVAGWTSLHFIFGLFTQQLAQVYSQYSLKFTNGDYGNCGSTTVFEVTFTDDTGYNTVSFDFTPSSTVGGEFTRTFSGTWIGFIQEMKLKATDWDGWCFKQFTLLQDINITDILWIDCNTIGYNVYDSISLDGDGDVGRNGAVDITLDLSRSSPTLNCTWTTSTAFTNTNDCENIDGGGWKLVRHVSDDYGGWHPASDDCLGTEEYGIFDSNAQSSDTYSISFESVVSGDYNQFLFAFGDCSSWIVTTKYEAIGEYYNDEYRCILNSSETSMNSQPYPAIWNNRGDVWSEDPWISLLDNSVSVDDHTVLYVENNSTSYIVWIRQVDNDTRYCWDTERPTPKPTASPIDEYQGIYNSNDFYLVNRYKCSDDIDVSKMVYDTTIQECQNECINYYDNSSNSECVCAVYYADSFECNLYSNCYINDLVIDTDAAFYGRYQYDVYQDYGCSGQNDGSISGQTLEECANECNDNNNYTSFEYYSSNLCQLSSTCDLLNGAQELTYSGGLTVSLYIKVEIDLNSFSTATPTSIPTRVPTPEPTDTPIREPTTTPSTIPITITTKTPPTIASDTVSSSSTDTTGAVYVSSKVTSTTVSPRSTKSDTSSNSDSANSGNNSNSSSNETLLYLMLIICGTIIVIVLLFVCLCFGYKYMDMKHRKAKQNNNNNTTRHHPNMSTSLGSNSVRGMSTGFAMANTEGTMIDLQRITSASHTSLTTAAQIPVSTNVNSGNDANVLSDLFADLDDVKSDKISKVGSLDSTGADGDNLCIGGEENNDNNNNKHTNYNNSDDDHSLIYEGNETSPNGDGENRHSDMDSDHDDGAIGGDGDSNYNAVGGIATTKGGKLMGKGIGSDVNVNQANYQEWTQKEVLVWIKINLVNNGIENEMIKSFLTEFATKYITGPMLKQLKENKKYIDALKTQFSNKNQAFGIWMVVESAIDSIGKYRE